MSTASAELPLAPPVDVSRLESFALLEPAANTGKVLRALAGTADLAHRSI